MNKKTELHSKAITLTAAAICVALACALLLLPKSDWSENENRQLASFPELSTESLASGEYLTGIEEYLADHFPLRDFFVSINTRFCTILGRREINDVYICDDGFLIDRYDTPARTDTILAAFNRLAEGVGDRSVTLLLAPTAEAVYSDKLPDFAPQTGQLEVMNQYYRGFKGSTVDVCDVLMDNRSAHQLYYRTDHHWTTYGAYYAYTEYCSSIGLEPLSMDDYEVRCVADDFRGTTYSKVNDFSIPGEEMHAFIRNDQNFTVEYVTGSGTVPGMLYNEEYLGKKDKYSYFLDNIHEQITITNPDAPSPRQLVVVKDSYANCFVPFLADHFSRITVIDPRYYRGSIIDFINADDSITDVLILYNLGTLDSDTGAAVIF